MAPTIHAAPAREVQAPTGQSATNLHIPESTFSPATVDPNNDGVASNALVDDQQNFPFRVLHQQSYASFGRVTGVYEFATWSPSGATDTNSLVAFQYHGSIFSNATGAQGSWSDIVNFVSSVSGAQVTDCTKDAGMTCKFISADVQSTTFDLYFLQYNQCTAEVESNASDAVYTANAKQIATTTDAIGTAAIQALNNTCGTGPTTTPTTNPTPTTTPTPPPASVDFRIISLRVEKNGAKPDWKQTRPTVDQITVGKKVQFRMYFQVTSAAPGAPVTAHWVVTRGGQTALTDNYTFNLDKTDPTGTYYVGYKGYGPKNAGTYHIAGSLSIGSKTANASGAFSVLKKPAPPPPPVSMSFDKIMAVNASGQPKTVFAVREDVKIVVVYTVRNLKSGKALTGQINTSFISPATNQKLFGNTVGIAVGHNGSFTSVGDDTGGFTAPGTFQVQVGISLGRSFATRQVNITIR